MTTTGHKKRCSRGLIVGAIQNSISTSISTIAATKNRAKATKRSIECPEPRHATPAVPITTRHRSSKAMEGTAQVPLSVSSIEGRDSMCHYWTIVRGQARMMIGAIGEAIKATNKLDFNHSEL